MPSLESEYGYCEAPCFAPLQFVLGKGWTCPRCTGAKEGKAMVEAAAAAAAMPDYACFGDELRAVSSEAEKKDREAFDKKASTHWVEIRKVCMAAAKNNKRMASYTIKEGNSIDNERVFTFIVSQCTKERMAAVRTDRPSGPSTREAAPNILDIEIRWT